jgi:membrane fusion protein (multidrug efflux system)
MKKLVFIIGFTLVCTSAIALLSGHMSKKTETPPEKIAAQATPVVVAPARYDTFSEHIEALGTTAANESVVVTADVTGRITKINFEDGGTVNKGTVLVLLDDEEERASLAAAQANLTTQQAQYNRLLDLARQKSAAQTTVEAQENTLKTAEAELEIARARLGDRRIEAPFAGQVGIRRVSPGALVSPGAEIVTLDDLSLIKLDFSVPETFLSLLRQGLDIEAQSIAYPDQLFRGKVTAIGSRVDPVTRTVIVRAELPNAVGLLRPGMLMTVDLIKNQTRSLVIPEESVIPVNDRQHVYRVNVDNLIEQVEVTIGRRRPGEVEILSGLESGDSVVVEGTTRVRPQVLVKVVRTQNILSDAAIAGDAATPMNGSLLPAKAVQ